MKKGICALCACAIVFCSSFSITASAGSMTPYYTPYGYLTGSSDQTTWQYGGSPLHRKIYASTGIPNAAPHIVARVYAYYNNTLVLDTGDREKTDATSASADVSSTQYANNTLTGHGVHSVWSSSYSRMDHLSNF